ncbi:hypothetical protein HanXRQr2_Chr02g0051051 [Helianthus annuus]|uniref:Uncharacterized protein n=1 Tax=Helianthus annuus TaxID=4232 RepID=A0A251VDG9_HELAN|nr:hypothetical protein HanXRQr2_Chr02g0051051 [Helianthus annuus]KAJ0495290.1 hypothetical protein HanIR_Chr12g0607221 [Helianthus annuus]KAJ0914269.1 hypothetical protein HanPSC8_Chr06g0236641 [Helianthus annuus]
MCFITGRVQSLSSSPSVAQSELSSTPPCPTSVSDQLPISGFRRTATSAPVCFNNQRRRRFLGLLCSLLRRRRPAVNKRAVAASRLFREPTTIRSRC